MGAMADDIKAQPKDFWDKFRIGTQAVGVVLISGVIAFVTVWIDAGIKNRQVDLEIVRLAVGILQEDPEETGLTALREWSMDAIDAYSGIPLPASAREELRNQPLTLPTRFNVGGGGGGGNGGFGGGGGGGFGGGNDGGG